ncbi:Clan SB, family S8, subtilisin-like serine peptidase [Histomonas meleagridis]|uniref:Clan SB, family S8, subtilisin-like serine peptidase n=1 Tax=Histomonas meleagridis TaxID=135588 RepID=UPI003559EF93|nr:Clan SB, family S8, subtilisin-like serine peptidase [Histomonas meleagridis]KAH0805338.1 Clan SB, family S8, subtilisin-like serine peptidase [Histomonas meleagridis]
MNVLITLIIITNGVFSYSDPTQEPDFNKSFNFLNEGIYGGIKGEDLNIVPAWKNNFTGKGVHISLFDAGCQFNHVDLKDKFRFEDSWNALTNEKDPFNQSKDPYHGTCTAGLAVGASNGIATVGAAPGANFSSITVDAAWESTGNIDLPTLIDVYSRTQFDVRSCSLGLGGLLRNGTIYMHQYRDVPEIENMLNKIMTFRNGKGAIMLHADGNSGNEVLDTHVDLLTKYRNVLAIGGSTNRGAPLSYSQTGANVMVNAPSGGTSYMSLYEPYIYCSSNEDLEGIHTFTGTSASSPQIAGVVALILEANPELTWRDVIYILALTAQINDPTNELWQENAAGYLYHPVLGFGRADAALATTTAQTWKNVAEEKSYTISSDVKTRVHHAREEWTEIEFEGNETISFIEYIYIVFDLNTSTAAFLHIQLISPEGTERTILEASPTYGEHFPNDLSFKFGVRSFFGESTKGKWVLRIRYESYITNVEISNLKLIFYGTKDKPNLPIITRRETAKNVVLIDNGKPTNPNESINVTNAICGEKMRIELQTNNMNDIPVLIVNPSNSLTLDLGTMHNKVLELDAPCVFKDGLELYVSARITGEETIISTPVIFHNPIQTLGINSPKENEIIKYNINGNNPILNLMWVRNDVKPKNNGCKQMAVISVVDFDTNEIIAYKTSVDIGRAMIELPKKTHKRCVVTITPVNESNFDPCSVLVQKFSLIGENEEIGDDKFELSFPESKCFESEGEKNNKKKLIIICVTCGIIVIIIVVGLIIGCRKCKEENQNKTITQSLNTYT